MNVESMSVKDIRGRLGKMYCVSVSPLVCDKRYILIVDDNCCAICDKCIDENKAYTLCVIDSAYLAVR